MKRPMLFISFNILVIVALSLVQVVVANSISTTGIELGKLQNEISELKKKNTILHEQVLVSASLTTIASEAATLGFEETSSPIVLSQPLPLARR
jgi:cell division protein FtsL